MKESAKGRFFEKINPANISRLVVGGLKIENLFLNMQPCGGVGEQGTREQGAGQ